MGTSRVLDSAMSSVGASGEACLNGVVSERDSGGTEEAYSIELKCGRRADSTSLHTVCTIISSARVTSFPYCVTSSSKMVPSGTSSSVPRGWGRDAAASARARRAAL